MGHLHASELADAVSGGSVSLLAALDWHLTHNHYPPVPSSMIAACVAAIDAYPDSLEDPIPLPEGVTWRGQRSAPAWAIIEGHHLADFLDDDEGER